MIEFLSDYCYYKRMMDLTSKQRKELEKASHTLKPVVIVGKNGISESRFQMVKFDEFKDEKRELVETICNATDATVVRRIGNIAILFKQQEDPEKRKIKITFD